MSSNVPHEGNAIPMGDVIHVDVQFTEIAPVSRPGGSSTANHTKTPDPAAWDPSQGARCDVILGTPFVPPTEPHGVQVPSDLFLIEEDPHAFAFRPLPRLDSSPLLGENFHQLIYDICVGEDTHRPRHCVTRTWTGTTTGHPVYEPRALQGQQGPRGRTEDLAALDLHRHFFARCNRGVGAVACCLAAAPYMA